ncbi:4Fe-4S binding domain protein, partial [human gut metagenome]
MERTCGTIRRVAWRSKCREAAEAVETLARGLRPVQTASWSDSYRMTLVGDRATLSGRAADSRLFYDLFLGDYCLGRACYERCPYRGFRSAADLRLGDLWEAASYGEREGVSTL